MADSARKYFTSEKSCNHKIRFANNDLARRWRDREHGYNNPNHIPYKCDQCPWWHIKYSEAWGRDSYG